MTHSRLRVNTANSSSKSATKRQDTAESPASPKKRGAKKIVSKPRVENVESEAPSSDNRLQAPTNVHLSSRKQTSVVALAQEQPIESVAVVSDFSTPAGSDAKLTRSLLPKQDNEAPTTANATDKKRKRVLPTPTSGLTATQAEDKESSGDDEQDEESLTPSSKRCCKSDLKRCLRAGDLIENSRVPEHILKSRNGGKKLLAQFDGQNFIDLQTEKSYRSITNWVKDRMLDLGKISTTSNISGWDYAIVHREGRTTTLRLLVEETKQKADQMRVAMKEQREGTFASPMLSTMFSESTSPMLGSSSNSIYKQSPQVKLTPTFGMPSVLGNSATKMPTEAALHQHLMDLRHQIAEVEHHLYVARDFAK